MLKGKKPRKTLAMWLALLLTWYNIKIVYSEFIIYEKAVI